MEPGIGSKCFLKRDKFPFVREDICKIYYLGSCELAPDLKHGNWPNGHDLSIAFHLLLFHNWVTPYIAYLRIAYW